MSNSRFPAISIDIEEKITKGYYYGRIPAVESLVKEYNSSRQTVTNALRPLIHKKLLIPKSNGTWINRRYRIKHGIIGIVVPVSTDTMIHHYDFQSLVDRIQADGRDILILDISQCRFSPNMKSFFGNHFEGFIFTNSTLTVEVASYLDKQKIPFVSCNRLPVYPHLNFIDYNNTGAIGEITGNLVQAGYRDICLFFPARLEGYNDIVRKNWHHIKDELGLPISQADNFKYNWRKSAEENLQLLLKGIIHDKSWPQALIFWSNLFKMIDLITSVLPPECLLIAPAGEEREYPSNVILTRKPNQGKLLQEAYQLLRELMTAPGTRPRHQYIDMPISYLQPIPKYHQPAGFESLPPSGKNSVNKLTVRI